MELTFDSNTIRYLENTFSESRVHEQTQEVIVPDAQPDVGKIVLCTAQLTLRSKECRAGSVTISGAAQTVCLYAPEDGGEVHRMDAWLPFTVRVDCPAAKEDDTVLCTCRVQSCDARILNSRKVMLRLNVGCRVEGYAAAEQEIRSVQNAPECLQMLEKQYTLTLPAEAGEKVFAMTEELELPAGKEAAEKMIAWEMRPWITDSRVVGNKAVCKGTLAFRALYLDANGAFDTVSQSFLFSQFCELAEEYDDGEAEICVALTGCDLEIADGGRRLLLAADLLAQYVVSKKQTVSLCEDAYTTKGTMEAEFAEYALPAKLDRQTASVPVRDSLEGALKTVLWSDVWMGDAVITPTEQGIRAGTDIQVQIVGLDAEGTMQTIREKTKAEFETELHPDARCRALCMAEPEGYAVPGAGGTELRYAAGFTVEAFAGKALRGLKSGTLEHTEEKHGRKPVVILRKCSARQPIWDVARQYGASVSAIMTASALESDEAEAGQMLLIPM